MAPPANQHPTGEQKPLSEAFDPRPRRRRRWGVLLLVLLAFVFCVKIANYAFPEAIRFPSIASWLGHRTADAKDWYATQPNLHSPPKGQRMVVVPGGFIYTSGRDDTLWTHIFATYPLRAPGSMPAIYPNITGGSITAADDLVRGQFDLPRFRPVTIDHADLWRADPYHDVYWRFYYYSLRPTVNLLAAYERTHEPRYVRALLAIDESFFRSESSSPYAWQDDHAVAFRSMILTYEWWELRRLHALTVVDSTAFLQELVKTGNFLQDSNHYQPEMNHGTNQSAALFQLGVDFPGLPGAAAWLDIARTRLAQSLSLIIDQDGVLIENSPYYHFYELDKLWQIYVFSRAVRVPIAATFRSRLQDMINYATYILQPNDTVPLLGASLARSVHDNGVFAAIAKTDPALLYVLTQGRSGTPPPRTSVAFASSGETILRSGWGKGPEFDDAAYLTFNLGAYRTLHSHLDALSFTLYDNGATLLPDAGLYTYIPGPMHDYFHGTSAHNAVVVDGKSQLEGSASAGPLVRRGGVTYQSGYSPLYAGVSHMRTLMMLDKNHFLVIDRLASGSVHTYQQIFHLFPGARLKRDGLTITGVGATPAQSVTIQQLDSEGITLDSAIGQTNPPAGLFSTAYGAYEPNYALSYAQRERNAAYTTLISVGPPDPQFSVSFDAATNRLVVRDDGRVFRMTLGESSGRSEWVKATHPSMPSLSTRTIPGVAPWSKWTAAGAGTVSEARASDDGGSSALLLTASSGTESATDTAVRGDLSASNLQLRMKVTGYARVGGLTLELSNHNWSSSIKISLRDCYTRLYVGEWMTFSLARGPSLPTIPGQWVSQGRRFDWGSVDAARITLDANTGKGPQPHVEIESLRSMPEQRSGRVVFVFDDGYSSILPAARYLHGRGIAANVAAIGKVIELPWRNYLNPFELRMLQNQWGWNIINHTKRHKDAVTEYYARKKFGAYEQDIIDGALALQREGLNSAPNWFIYPHGSTNAALAKVVGRFYTFARTVDGSPEAYPFGSPLRVKTLELHSPGDVYEGSGSLPTSPELAITAVRDAERYHTTLILTFHRIKATPFDRPGYPITEFKAIVDAVKRIGIPTMTLSQLDAANGVPEDSRVVVRPAVPPLVTVAFKDATPQQSLWSRLFGIF